MLTNRVTSRQQSYILKIINFTYNQLRKRLAMHCHGIVRKTEMCSEIEERGFEGVFWSRYYRVLAWTLDGQY
jgi:hypothetical protein